MGDLQSTSASRDAFQRFLRMPVARFALILLVIVATAAVIGPERIPPELRGTGGPRFSPPSAQHWLGTDLNGRDVLYRVLMGARISLVVGIAGALVSLLIGTTWGLVAGYFGGAIDAVMMRIVDILYSVPRLLFLLIFINLFDQPFRRVLHENFDGTALEWTSSYAKIVLLILTLGAIEWLTMARIVRGQVLVLKQQTFVLAARSLGQRHSVILHRHLLPNIRGLILVYLTLTIPTVIIDESFISFLGLGLDASQASWGVLLSDGAHVINPVRSYWWLLLFPAMLMALTLLALNFVGDGLRDAFDPRSQKM